MHKLHELKEKLMRELEDYSENGKFSKDDVESIKYITSAIDHICNIMEDSEDYSMATDGRYMYDGGMSYERGGNHTGGRGNTGRSYARGRRRGGANQYGSYAGGYSMEGEDFRMEFEEMIESAPNERIKTKMRELMREM